MYKFLIGARLRDRLKSLEQGEIYRSSGAKIMYEILFLFIIVLLMEHSGDFSDILLGKCTKRFGSIVND